jgi:anti-sigma factor ChrR (cupin superfamily)
LFERARIRRSAIAIAVATATAAPAPVNPVVSVHVTNASPVADITYVASASTLGGYIVSDNDPGATISHGTTDAYTVKSANVKAIAGELIYRAANDSAHECTFDYVLVYAGKRFTATTRARASWTGAAVCTSSSSGLDQSTGNFSVTFTMQ